MCICYAIQSETVDLLQSFSRGGLRRSTFIDNVSAVEVQYNPGTT